MSSLWRIRHRLLFLALLPAAVLSLVLLSYFVVSGLNALDAEMRARGETTVRSLAPASEYAVISGHQASLRALAEATMRQPDVRGVGIMALDGSILALIGTPQNPLWQRGGAGRFAGEGWTGFSEGIRRTMIEFEDYPDPSQPPEGETVMGEVGTVYVEFSTANLHAQKRALIGSGLLILCVGLAVAAAIALRMARGFSEPLRRLIAGVGSMGEGRLDARVPEESSGELAILERGFNDMARRLQDLLETMEGRIDAATAQLAFQARHDPLTGLINRREFERRLDEALRAVKAGAGGYVLCFIDLDRFKTVNDTCGHIAGDELLRQLAQLLQRRTREGDVLARLGGDEFGILLSGCDEKDALRVVESLRRLVEEYRFGWQEHVFAVGASIGMVVVDGAAKDVAELLSLADQGCYLAKEKGRNRIQVCRREEREFLVRRGETNWAECLATAIEENRLFFVAQAVHSLCRPEAPAARGDQADAARETHVRLMLRLPGANGEAAPPSAFLPAAERADLVPALDRWAVAAACRAVADFSARDVRDVRDRGRLLASVSLAGIGEADALFALIEAETARLGISPASLCFSVGEAQAGAHLAEVMQLEQGLRALGCRFCLERFGSGFASFSYLRHLPPDFVRIDPAIVRDAATDRVSRTTLAAIRDMGRELGFRVIAEAVDDEAIRSALCALDIDLGQGELFDVPLPFALWLDRFFARART
ncbi:MAG: diguanylate cyclase [Azospira sp.]|jgi:diguanylate cyclase (GGDEF)-like protein|nr:diguanylate cyclase [Azospira sp.]